MASSAAPAEKVVRLTRREARRIAIRAQWLDATRPKDLLTVAQHLGAIQVDLTDYVAPSADLVLWSRLGRAYDPRDLETALGQGDLIELQGMIRPSADLALFRAAMRAWPGEDDWRIELSHWLGANEGCRRDLLAALRSDGPLPAADLPDSCVVPWRSTGWSNNKNVQRMLDVMEARGEVAVAGRDGRARLWDLAERVYPEGRPEIALGQVAAARDQRILRSLGIARAKSPVDLTEPVQGGVQGVAASIEGVRGVWRVDPDQLDREFRGRAAILSPLDRLIIERKRMAEIFEFDYTLEMFKPKKSRKWGYYALPILYGDALVGKADVQADLLAGHLRVDAVHEVVALSRTARSAIDGELSGLADMLGLRLVGARTAPPRTS